MKYGAACLVCLALPSFAPALESVIRTVPLAQPKAREAAAKPEALAGFDGQVARAVKDWRAPGFAIAIVKDGDVIFSKGYGVRELGKPGEVDTHSLFAIGSTTKAMTAAAIGMLVDEKKIGWDDSVTKHLPWFAVHDPMVTRELTVRDLLTHRGGLPNADFLWYGQNATRQTILERLRFVEPAYSVRSSFIYQNVMYGVAGAVIEAASGMSWERFIETRIFAPLSMSDSVSTSATLAAHANRAEPHFLIGENVTVIENASVDGVAPAGAIWSSVSDMAKWMRFLLQGGIARTSSGDVRLLSEATVNELFRPQTIVTKAAFYPTAEITKPNWTTYGLGWFQQDYAGRKVDFHTGSIDGMVAICGLIRSEGIGVFVLSNLDHAELRHALMLTAFDRLLARPARDWNAEFKALYARLHEESEVAQRKEDGLRMLGTKPSLPITAYAGDYADPLFGDVTVVLDEKGQGLAVRYGDAHSGPLEHWNFDTFRARWNARWRGTVQATFVLDGNGRVSGLQMFGGSFKRREAR